MPNLAELPEIIGFFSYSRDDDQDSDGALTTLRRRIQSELRGQLGRTSDTLRLWQDAEAIPPGTLWNSQIEAAIAQAVFFIPIVTPRVINSKYCEIEFGRFLAREKEIGRSDLIFPIIYIGVDDLKYESRWRDHPILQTIAERHYVDWSEDRYDFDNVEVRRRVGAFSRTIVAALRRSPAEQPVSSARRAERSADEGIPHRPTSARADETRPHQEIELTQRTEAPPPTETEQDFARETGPTPRHSHVRSRHGALELLCILLIFHGGTQIISMPFIYGGIPDILKYLIYMTIVVGGLNGFLAVLLFRNPSFGLSIFFLKIGSVIGLVFLSVFFYMGIEDSRAFDATPLFFYSSFTAAATYAFTAFWLFTRKPPWQPLVGPHT